MHPKPLVRRTHSPEFKARVLAACRQNGASVAGVALAHGINPNVVHKWLAGIGMKRAVQHLPTQAHSNVARVAPVQFLSVGLLANSSERDAMASDAANKQDIRLNLDLGAMQVKLHCPRESAPTAAALLHALAEMVARA